VTRCLTAQLIALSTLAHAPLPADRDAALQGHSLALHSAVPRPSRARRLSGGAGQLRGVSAVCLGPRRQGRAAAPSAISINYCALSSRRRLGSSLTSTCVCMRWPRGPTLSFLGGPAEVQPFGPLRAFLKLASFQRPAGGLYGLLAGLPLARRKLVVQEAYARRGGAQQVALRSKIVEPLPSGRPRNWGSWEIAFFATVYIIHYTLDISCCQLLRYYIEIMLQVHIGCTRVGSPSTHKYITRDSRYDVPADGAHHTQTHHTSLHPNPNPRLLSLPLHAIPLSLWGAAASRLLPCS